MSVRRIAKNTVFLLFTQIIIYLIGFLYVIYSARYLGVLEFGMLSFALSLTGILSFFTDFGLGSLATREVAKNKSLTSKYVGNILAIKFLLSIATLIIISIIIIIMGYSGQMEIILYLFTFYIIFNSFSSTFCSIYQAYEKMEFQSITQISNSILILIGIIFAINKNYDVIGFASIYFISGILIFLFNIVIFIWKFTAPKLKFDLKFWKKSLKIGLPFGFGALFISIYFSIDSVLLSIIQGNTSVGYYNAAYRLAYALLFVPTAYFTSIYPVMSKYYKNEGNLLTIMYRRSFKYMFIIVILIAITTTLLADKIILFLYGVDYYGSIIALQILIWAIFFSYLAYSPTYSLYSVNKQKTHAKITFIGMIANIILNLISIKLFSYIGASIATVITEAFVFFLLIIYTRKLALGAPVNNNFIIKMFFVSIILILFIYSLSIFINFIGVILITIPFYLILLWLTHIVSPEDIEIVKKILNLY